jgi:hypothetical protein
VDEDAGQDHVPYDRRAVIIVVTALFIFACASILIQLTVKLRANTPTHKNLPSILSIPSIVPKPINYALNFPEQYPPLDTNHSTLEMSQSLADTQHDIMPRGNMDAKLGLWDNRPIISVWARAISGCAPYMQSSVYARFESSPGVDGTVL